jgi:hypothetical protein
LIERTRQTEANFLLQVSEKRTGSECLHFRCTTVRLSKSAFFNPPPSFSSFCRILFAISIIFSPKLKQFLEGSRLLVADWIPRTFFSKHLQRTVPRPHGGTVRLSRSISLSSSQAPLPPPFALISAVDSSPEPVSLWTAAAPPPSAVCSFVRQSLSPTGRVHSSCCRGRGRKEEEEEEKEVEEGGSRNEPAPPPPPHSPRHSRVE